MVLALGCARQVRKDEPAPFPRLTLAQAIRLLPPTVRDREAWARSVLTSLDNLGIAPSPPAVCQVLAVIEQESGYDPNPAVPDLAKLVRARLDGYAQRLGPVGPRAMHELLKGKAPGTKDSFEQRLGKLRTERDLDVLFRDLLAHYRGRYPGTYATLDLLGDLFTSRSFEDLNPVTTAGAMQVSVRFAEGLAERERRPKEEVRDSLYTREGGVRYGTARLLGYEAGYAEPLFRFADYNAGVYASRNAALQAALARLTGVPLKTDGDLLAYDARGEPLDKPSQTLTALFAFRRRYAPQLSEGRIRRDAEKEKQLDLEATETYRAVRRAFERLTGAAPPYAQVPEVSLESPKLKRSRTTAWFARSVAGRYQRCLARAEAAPTT